MSSTVRIALFSLTIVVTAAMLAAWHTGLLAQREPPTDGLVGVQDNAREAPRSETGLDKQQLLQRAGQGPEERDRVIAELIAIVDTPLDAVRQYPDAQVAFVHTWIDACGLLGELKATQAIDVLVGQIAWHGVRGGFSRSEFPALTALVDIGLPALPALEKALLENPDPAIRGQAAIGLGEIGGEDARRALQEALRTESDEKVLWYIRNNLRAIRERQAGR